MTGFKFSAKCDKKCIYSDNLHAFIIIYKVFKVIISVRNKTFAAQKTLKLMSNVSVSCFYRYAIFAGNYSIMLAASAFYGQTNASPN